jgi:hypothetical protein
MFVERAKALISSPSVLKEKWRDPPSWSQYLIALSLLVTAACGVKHATVYSFPNMAYKSAYVNPFSALRNSRRRIQTKFLQKLRMVVYELLTITVVL